ncbi:protachykinin-like [Denticeps clupeoides]|uniref:protachykinin-like n=1 Tax=Denticeps clupeoides TaxID=299321 RepID=UPI0010A52F3A|nr:protachykinin-like [Denticeps clupeoides]
MARLCRDVLHPVNSSHRNQRVLGDMMKILLPMLLLLISANVFCRELNSNQDNLARDNHSEVEPALLLRRMKGTLFALMGRRSGAKTQATRKRQRFHSFVGLMGKRFSDVPGFP